MHITYTAQLKLSMDFNMKPHFNWIWCYQHVLGSWNLRFFVSARQKVIGLGVSRLALNLMSWAWKGYKSTSEIKTFDSNEEQKVLKDKDYCPLEIIKGLTDKGQFQ